MGSDGSFKMPVDEIRSYGDSSDRLSLLMRHIQQLEHDVGCSYKDARVVTLKNLDAHVSSVAMIHMLRRGIEDGSYPLEPLRQVMELDEEIVVIAFNRLEQSLRLGFTVLYQFQVENLLKNLLRALGETPPTSFYKSAERLLNRISVTERHKKLETLNVVALIRNSMHSNGIHYSRDKSSTRIAIKGIVYDFEYGKKVSCAGWSYLIPALHAGLNVLEEILMSPEVRALPEPVRDEYAAVMLGSA